jgi:hypothetical protein
MAKEIDNIVDSLWSANTAENWNRLREKLGGSNIRYYHVVFEHGLRKADDMNKSYVGLYDSKRKLVAKVPVAVKDGKRFEGALIYLKGLSNMNKVD